MSIVNYERECEKEVLTTKRTRNETTCEKEYSTKYLLSFQPICYAEVDKSNGSTDKICIDILESKPYDSEHPFSYLQFNPDIEYNNTSIGVFIPSRVYIWNALHHFVTFTLSNFPSTSTPTIIREDADYYLSLSFPREENKMLERMELNKEYTFHDCFHNFSIFFPRHTQEEKECQPTLTIKHHLVKFPNHFSHNIIFTTNTYIDTSKHGGIKVVREFSEEYQQKQIHLRKNLQLEAYKLTKGLTPSFDYSLHK